MYKTLVLAALCLMALAGQAAAQNMTSAERFLRILYDGYTKSRKVPDPIGKDPGRLFTPALAGLINADRALALGELGILDINPICACQDWAGLPGLGGPEGHQNRGGAGRSETGEGDGVAG